MSRPVPGSRLALTWRRLRGRFGISAPRLAVRAHLPWHLRLATVLGSIALLAIFSGWAYDAGRKSVGYDHGESAQQASQLRQANAGMEEEVARLRSLLMTSESNLQIERAAQKQLAERNNALAQENTQLKADIAVFERLMKLESRRDAQVTLDRLSVRQEAAGQYRFSFVATLQGQRRGKESSFDMEITVFPRADSADGKITIPRPGDPDAASYKFSLRNFRRIDGRFAIPPDYRAERVEIRVLEQGQMKASGSVLL